MGDPLRWIVAIALVLILPVVAVKSLRYLARNMLTLAALLVTIVPASAVFLLRQESISPNQAVVIAGAGGALCLGLCVLPALESPARPAKGAGLVLTFASIELFAALLNGQIEISLYGIGHTITILAAPVLAFSALRSLPRHQIATMVLVVGGGLIGASYVLEFMAPSGAPSDQSRFGIAATLGRLSGVTTSPNAFGAVGLAFTLAALSAKRGRSRVLLVTIALPAVLLSQQRAAVLGAVLGGLTFLYYRQKIVFILTAIAVTALALLPSSPFLVNSSATTDDTTVQSRLVVWRYVGQHWTEAIPYGWGPQGLRERSLALGLPEAYSHAHNQLINALVVGGVLMLLVMVGLIVRMLQVLNRADQADLVQQLVLILGLAPLFLFESPMQTGMNPLTQPQVAVVWLVVALSLSPVARADRSGRTTEEAAVAHA